MIKKEPNAMNVDFGSEFLFNFMPTISHVVNFVFNVIKTDKEVYSLNNEISSIIMITFNIYIYRISLHFRMHSFNNIFTVIFTLLDQTTIWYFFPITYCFWICFNL